MPLGQRGQLFHWPEMQLVGSLTDWCTRSDRISMEGKMDKSMEIEQDKIHRYWSTLNEAIGRLTENPGDFHETPVPLAGSSAHPIERDSNR